MNRRIAADAVSKFDLDARPAVPALLTALSDPDDIVRLLATKALREIAPEALTNAPPPP